MNRDTKPCRCVSFEPWHPFLLRLIQGISEKKMEWLLHRVAYHKAGHKKESAFQVWQEGFLPEEIGSAEMFRQKATYLH